MEVLVAAAGPLVVVAGRGTVAGLDPTVRRLWGAAAGGTAAPGTKRAMVI